MHLTDGKDPEIGYWIDSNISGLGITSKAAGVLSEFGFETLGLSRIVIKAEPDNTASNKIAKKLGYELETTALDDAAGVMFNVWSKTNV